MDPTNFAAPAQVKALLVPVGPITVGQFQHHYDRLRQAAQVPLIDIHLPSAPTGATDTGLNVPGTHKPDTSSTTTFDPRANPTGRLTYSFETSPITESHQSLVDLEPWRLQFLIVGIAQAGDSTQVGDLQSSLAELRKIYSKSIYHVVLLFDAPDPVTEELTRSDAPGKGIFPVSRATVTALDSTLSTVTGHFLAHLSTFWTVRQLSSFQSPAALFSATSSSSTGSTPHGHHHEGGHQHSPSAVTLGRHGSISMTSTERAKSRQDGRTRKFLGNLYLLSGRISDALTEFGMAATVLKEHSDHLWFGSALGDIGLCLVIQAFDRGPHGIPSAAVTAAWSFASRYLKKTKSSRASAHHPPMVHATVTDHHAPGMHAGHTPNRTERSPSVTSAESVGEISSGVGHHNNVNGNAASSSPSIGATGRMGSTPQSSVSLTRIASLRKFKPFTDQTPVPDILEFIIAASLDEFSTGQAMEIVPYTVYYEAVVRYANFLISLRFGEGWTDEALEAALGYCQLNPSSSTTSAECPSIVDVEKWIAKIYELSLHQLEPDVQALILGSVARLYARAGLKRKWAFTCSQVVNLLASSRATVQTDLGQVAEVLQVYTIWPKLEAQVLRKLIPLGQRIHNAKLQTDAASQLLALVCRDGYPMVDKEQLTLYHLIRSYSDVTQATFWDPKLVESATVKTHRLASVRSSIVGTASNPSSSGTRASSKGSHGALIYNPFDAPVPKERGSIEAGVPTTAKILIRNPLAIEIQVFELALVDREGNYVSEVVKGLTLPPNTSHFKIEATVIPPANKSSLVVSGCYVQISGCSRQIYALPEINIPIISARPVLVLQELSLLKGWTMLLEGERKQFSITLWNSSKILNEILHFGFNDSTVDSLRTAASRQDVSRAEFYEYEYFLHKRRAIDLLSNEESSSEETASEGSASEATASDDQSSQEDGSVNGMGDMAKLPPHGSRTFNFQITGKRGVSMAAVLVDYGLSEDTLRRLKIPLQVTIYPSISVERANILPSAKKNTVLLVLDLRNLWRESLTCKVWASDAPETIQRVDSSTTSRFLVEVPWEPFPPEDLRRPIPNLSSRQYTVDTKTTPEQLQLFWLREKLLSKLNGTWATDQGRSGYIELRMIQLSKRMSAPLRMSPVDVSAQLTRSPRAVDEPGVMTVSVVNKSANAVQGILRLIANKPAQRYMLVLGCLQQLVTVPPGEKCEVTFEMVFLNRGPYELTSVLDPINPSGPLETVFQSAKTIVHI